MLTFDEVVRGQADNLTVLLSPSYFSHFDDTGDDVTAALDAMAELHPMAEDVLIGGATERLVQWLDSEPGAADGDIRHYLNRTHDGWDLRTFWWESYRGKPGYNLI